MCKTPTRIYAAPATRDECIWDTTDFIDNTILGATKMTDSKQQNNTPFFRGTNAMHVATHVPTPERPAHGGTYSTMTDTDGCGYTFWLPAPSATSDADPYAGRSDPRLRQANEAAKHFWAGKDVA
jgi:hypothetical protein